MNKLFIKKTKNIIDVFKNTGWEDHTRFELQGKTLKFISGRTLSKEEFQQLKQELKNNATTG